MFGAPLGKAAKRLPAVESLRGSAGRSISGAWLFGLAAVWRQYNTRQLMTDDDGRTGTSLERLYARLEDLSGRGRNEFIKAVLECDDFELTISLLDTMRLSSGAHGRSARPARRPA
jgi:hypothetical protein